MGGLKWIRVGSEWIRMCQSGSEWARVGSEWDQSGIRVEQRVGSEWNRVDQNGTEWVRVDQSEPEHGLVLPKKKIRNFRRKGKKDDRPGYPGYIYADHKLIGCVRKLEDNVCIKSIERLHQLLKGRHLFVDLFH